MLADIDMRWLSAKRYSNLDMFHEQLPLPVPCSVFPSYRYEAWTISSSVLQIALFSMDAMTQ